MREVPWTISVKRNYTTQRVAWLGDPEATYTFSSVRHEPKPLTPCVAALRTRLVAELGQPFNGVLCNLYRDGADTMHLHSDAHPDLGPEPVLASVSLGAERPFSLHHKLGKRKLDLLLPSGSLLVMRGTTQEFFFHSIPPVAGLARPRVNFTFRWIRPPLQPGQG
jgi:alkylated DNA repair dioxygenase AlkB